ncbi:MAG: outer membrane protein beta-barrel domain [Holophagaceae bacterium]|nr:outer membrane protein beta-barrel domain [Holophagaceae bacterium]
MKSAFLLTALAFATVMGQSQDVKAGFQVTLSNPQGDLADLVDDNLGFGIGGHLFIDMKNGHALVPRIDYTAYRKTLNDLSIGSDSYYDYYATEVKVSTLALGADYNYFFSGRANRGLYLAAGVAFVHGKVTVDVDAYDNYGYAGTGSDSETKNALGYSFGGGYRFNPNVGIEVKYNQVSFDTGVYGLNLDAPSLNASFICRF